MIIGNRNGGKKMVVAVITILLAMLVMTVLVTTHRRSVPLQAPPLYPSVLVRRL